MLLTIVLSVLSNVTGAFIVPGEPTKLAFGISADNFKRVPVGTVPEVILAERLRVVDVITEDAFKRAVESDLLVSTDKPAVC